VSEEGVVMSDYTIDKPADECDHGIFPATACGMCKDVIEQKERHKTRETIIARWVAQYDGHCADCHDAIEVGDIICRMGDQRIVCQDCS
jgi:hypothetical protein